MHFLSVVLTWFSCWTPSAFAGSWLTLEPWFQYFLSPQLQPLLQPLLLVFLQLVELLFLVLGAERFHSSLVPDISPGPSRWLQFLFPSLVWIFSATMLFWLMWLDLVS